MSFKVLVTDRFEIDSFAFLQSDSRLDVKRSATPQPIAIELADVEGLLIRSRTKIDRALLEAAPNLKVVITATSGFDHIDLNETQRRKLTVMYTPEANAASACELTWALALACTRRIPEAHRAVKSGEWRREALLGRQLEGKTYGVVGLGRIGGRVARIAQAFGMKLVAFDPYRDTEHFEKYGAQRLGLEELFRVSDYVSLHVPASPETNGMIHRYLLDAANRGLILVNTSRGPVVSEQDLCEALTMGWIAGAGLDVFEREPLPRHSNLLNFSNVVLSPHIGATTTEAFGRASREAAEKLIVFVEKKAITDPLPPTDAWWMGGFSKDSLRQPVGG